MRTLKEIKENEILQEMITKEIYRKSEAANIIEAVNEKYDELIDFLIDTITDNIFISANDACGYYSSAKESLNYTIKCSMTDEIIDFFIDKAEAVNNKSFSIHNSYIEEFIEKYESTLYDEVWFFINDNTKYKQDCNDILSDFLSEDIKSYKYAEELLKFAKNAEENFGACYTLESLAQYALGLDLGII